MIEHRSDDERRRERERELLAAGEAERGHARTGVAAEARRRGELDLAALALEQALREGAPVEAVAPELAAVLVCDPGEAGAWRALGAFDAVRASEPARGPFPLVLASGAASLLLKRASLFQGAFRLIPRATTLALARSIAALVPGDPRRARSGVLAESGTDAVPEAELVAPRAELPAGAPRRGDWRAALGREVDAEEVRALDDLYARLQGIRRHRVCARLDTPGPLREVSSHRFEVAPGEVALALADSHLSLVFRGARFPDALTLHEEQTFAGETFGASGPVLAGAPADLEPRVVAASGGSWVVGVDAEGGELLASFSALPRFDLVRASRRVGRRVRLAAACAAARGLAVFLAPAARVVVVSPSGEVARERRLGQGLEVLDAASHGGGDVFVLARTASECLLLRLDAALERVGEPVRVPCVRSPRDARLAWPTADMVLVLEAPDVAHAFGADDRRLAWTARIPEPLEGLAPVAGEVLELLTYGPIESEWGLPGADVGLARWTRDGLGRHGPTVRVEAADPSRAVDAVEVATHGGRIGLACRAGRELSLRTLEVLATPARTAPPREWTYAFTELPPDD